MDSPLEQLSGAQVRGAGGCSRLERVVGGGGTKEGGSRQAVGGLRAMGGRGITCLCGPGSRGGCPTEWKGVSPLPLKET